MYIYIHIHLKYIMHTYMLCCSRSGQRLGLLFESAAEKLGLSTEELHGLLSNLRSQSVRIDDVEDFCIEYTYANPSLWLISASG